jgi:hypothetical protein
MQRNRFIFTCSCVFYPATRMLPGVLMNSRRKLLAALGATTLAMPLRAFAQQPSGKIPRLGILLFNSPQIDPVYVLVEALAALGHVVGKTSCWNTAMRRVRPSGFPRSPRNWWNPSPI